MRRRTWIAGGIVVGLLAVVAVALPFFLPERTTRAMEEAPEGATVVAQGTFSGKAGHSSRGTVLLVVAEGAYLRFEGFEQTSGPDVWLYLTPAPDPDSKEEVLAGIRLPVPGGADGGETTVRGDFNVPLPDGLDLASYQGVATWCEDFAVPFGSATLTPVRMVSQPVPS